MRARMRYVHNDSPEAASMACIILSRPPISSPGENSTAKDRGSVKPAPVLTALLNAVANSRTDDGRRTVLPLKPSRLAAGESGTIKSSR